jgi:hypothetical protein
MSRSITGAFGRYDGNKQLEESILAWGRSACIHLQEVRG